MFCASESATAVFKSSSSSSKAATIHLGGGSAPDSARAIDRHNPIIHASRRSLPSSHLQNLKPGRESCTYSSSLIDQSQTTAAAAIAERRKSSASLVDAVRKSSCIKPGAYFSPPPSSRTNLIRSKSQSYHKPDKEMSPVPAETGERARDPKAGGGNLVRTSSLKNDATTPLFVPSNSDKYYYSPFRINSDQVVVVRVSLHCKGCAGKVNKYISRMQGVTSFNVDFDAKKVIVIGDVTPLEVLASISKVRTAQLLPPEKPNDSPRGQTTQTSHWIINQV